VTDIRLEYDILYVVMSLTGDPTGLRWTFINTKTIYKKLRNYII
jgi:hypothetical protein